MGIHIGYAPAVTCQQTFSFVIYHLPVELHVLKSLDLSKLVKLHYDFNPAIQKLDLHILVLCRSDLWSRSLRF